MAIYPVILAGGSGTRLWPISRQNHPKQFLDLLGVGESLLQSTIKRAQACSDIDPLIIANKEHRFLLQHQIEPLGLSTSNVLLEPDAKNTTAAIAVACLNVLSKDPLGCLLVLPADHYLPDTAQFSKQITRFISSLAENEVGVAGIKPSFAATQYGYMALEQCDGFFKVARFIEKPNEMTAKTLFEKDGIAWNSGLVMGRASAILTQLERYEPQLLEQAKNAFNTVRPLYNFVVLGDEYKEIANCAFDISVLEKSNSLAACMLDQEWDDLGTWPSLLVRRKALGLTQFNVFSEDELTLAFGVDDVVLVKNDDVIFMAHQDALNDMNAISAYLQQHNLTALLNRIDVHRPWGQFKVLAQDDHFVVKRLLVYPFSQISLQSHEHRIENWVVVKGCAQVQLDDKTFELTVGQSISIKQKQKHRLSNPFDEPLEIIEVQSGSELKESDITRYDDQYERHIN